MGRFRTARDNHDSHSVPPFYLRTAIAMRSISRKEKAGRSIYSPAESLLPRPACALLPSPPTLSPPASSFRLYRPYPKFRAEAGLLIIEEDVGNEAIEDGERSLDYLESPRRSKLSTGAPGAFAQLFAAGRLVFRCFAKIKRIRVSRTARLRA
ncbi:hypothetical protein KM043_001673 [Ampulex compressa]|nr:hypothetical protein KM043_001673 [Ampulex compressa]